MQNIHTIVPVQYFGLGDIIFSQTLVRRIAQGRRILWGVMPSFIWQLEEVYPDIEWVDWRALDICDYACKEDKTVDGYRFLPIRWSCEYMGVPYANVMSAKYGMYGMDYRDWKEQAMWVRDRDKEHRLLLELGVKDKPFVLVCPNYSAGVVGIDIEGVRMQNVDGYSMFDWAAVFEAATHIHAVSTATLFMFQLLGIMSKVTLYPRLPNEKTLKNVEELL